MVASSDGWIGVDFDGTLADYSAGWQGPAVLGAPVPEMLARVKRWLADGREVRVFTARVWPLTDVVTEEYTMYLLHHINKPAGNSHREAVEAALAIQQWTRVHFGRALPITCVKDLRMVELYDDRCVQVIANTGQLVGSSSRGIPA